MPTSGNSSDIENKFNGCETFFFSDRNIDIRCDTKEQAEQLAEHLRNTGFGWIARADGREVNMERPRPYDEREVVTKLDRYHGVDQECEHIEEAVKELIEDYQLDKVDWETYTSTAEFANHVAPKIRRLAGYRDASGMGTYQEGDTTDAAREDEIYDYIREVAS